MNTAADFFICIQLSMTGTYISFVIGLYAAVYELFFPPGAPGQIHSFASLWGMNWGSTMGRPFSSSPLAQLSLSTYCAPCRYWPLARSITYMKPLRLGCANALTVLPLRCTFTKKRSCCRHNPTHHVR